MYNGCTWALSSDLDTRGCIPGRKDRCSLSPRHTRLGHGRLASGTCKLGATERQVYVNAYTHVYAHTSTHTHTHTQIRIHTSAHTHTHTQNKNASSDAVAHIHLNTHIHTHTHSHIRSNVIASCQQGPREIYWQWYFG